jgi:hypothetical protein
LSCWWRRGRSEADVASSSSEVDRCDCHEPSSSESDSETSSKAIVAKGTIGVQAGFAPPTATLVGCDDETNVIGRRGTRKSASSDEHDEASERTSRREEVAAEKVESMGEGSADGISRSGETHEAESTARRERISAEGAQGTSEQCQLPHAA